MIKTASEDAACLKGLYAIYSMAIPRTVHNITAKSIPAKVGSPCILTAKNTAKPPTIITSPWAKFNILAMPYTIVYPRAIIA